MGTIDITYEEAQEISRRFGGRFVERSYRIGPYKISTFSYTHECKLADFFKPIPERLDLNALEMRGITFIFNEDGSLWRRSLMLPKFFNINQSIETSYDNLKDKGIKAISEKADGSLIGFMSLPNGEIFAKTIGGFDSEIVKKAMEIAKTDKKSYRWMKSLLKGNITLLFELTSLDNRVVIRYEEPKLNFIGFRSNLNGEFITAEEIHSLVPENFNPIRSEKIIPLSSLIERSKTEKEKEGWVVIFQDGQMVKIKTKWYYQLHHLRTENIFREDYIIKNYLNGNLDDIVSQLHPENDKDALEFIENIEESINSYSSSIDKYVFDLYLIFESKYLGDWKEFSINCEKLPYFQLCSVYHNARDSYYRRKKEFILGRTSKLKGAKEIIERFKKK